jgi:hypothetical protein
MPPPDNTERENGSQAKSFFCLTRLKKKSPGFSGPFSHWMMSKREILLALPVEVVLSDRKSLDASMSLF